MRTYTEATGVGDAGSFPLIGGAFKLELKHHFFGRVCCWCDEENIVGIKKESFWWVWSIEMDAMQYAEGVVKEFLLFRGFTHTLQSFESELHADVGNGFQVHTLPQLISLSNLTHHQSKRRTPQIGFGFFFLMSSEEITSNSYSLPSNLHTQILANFLGQ